MNEQEWKQQSERLMASQEKFVEMMHLQHEGLDALTKYIQGFRDYMGGFREAFGGWSQVFKAIHEGMQEELAIVKQLNESLEAIKKAITDNYHATNENNERIEKLLTKVEAYFGTTGLDYDN